MLSKDTPIVFMTTETHISPNHWRVTSPKAALMTNGYHVTIQKGTTFDADKVPYGATVILLRASALDSYKVDEFFNKLHEKDCCIIYDTDDDIITPAVVDHMKQLLELHWSDKEAQQELGEHVLRKYIINQCDGVTVSTPALKNVLWEHTRKPVVVVPNAIDVDWYTKDIKPIAHFDDDVFIGWAGSGRPQRDLLEMAQAWGKIAKLHPNVSFVLGGWRPKVVYEYVPSDRIIYRPWTDLGNYPSLMSVDIGCTPLHVTPFNACKSPIKVWEYTLSGAAVVSSPLVYGQVVDHGQNGYLAQTTEEWVYYLDRLVRNPELRFHMKLMMMRDVRDRHSMGTQWTNWPLAYSYIEDITNDRIRTSNEQNQEVSV